MYAIIEDGSRQYRAEVDHDLVIDFREVELGSTVELDHVLLVAGGEAGLKIGQPHVKGAKVIAEVVDLPRKKSTIGRFRRRKNYRRLKGHTQPYIRVKVKSITV